MDLITGGSGYFGSVLVKRILSTGGACSILDLIDSDNRPPDVPFFQTDIRDEKGVLKACAGVETIYHAAAQVPLTKNKSYLQSVNIAGTETLLKVALKMGVKKVIYLSSSAVFGVPKVNPITEEMIPSPGEIYGKTKVAAEEICMTYMKKGLDVTIIRPRTVLGHGRLGVFQILFEWICEGYNVAVLGKGDNLYQCIHAHDLADACLRAASHSGASLYHCGTDRFGTMREALENLCHYANTGSRVRSVPMFPAVFAMKMTSLLGLSPLGAYHALMYGRPCYFDISKAQRELGWQPTYSNDEMLVENYEWYIKNRKRVLGSTGKSHQRSAVKEGILGLFKRCL